MPQRPCDGHWNGAPPAHGPVGCGQMKPALCTGFANWRLKPREAKGYFANTVEKGMKLNEKKRES